MKPEQPDTVLSPEEFLRAMVRGMGSQKAVAKTLSVSPTFLCDVLHGRRKMTLKLARALGYQQVVTYLPLPEGWEAERTRQGGRRGEAE